MVREPKQDQCSDRQKARRIDNIAILIRDRSSTLLSYRLL